MGFERVAEFVGETWLGPAGGLAIGLAFGFLAQRSAFCLRAASIETARGIPGPRLAIWLVTFASALIATQALIVAGAFDTGAVRQLASRGSLSGATIGGLLFGAGMVLARACASRMLVLAGSGNLRALLAGLVFAVTAQASRGGALAPAREYLGGLWTVAPAQRDILALTGFGHVDAIAFGALWFAAGIALAARAKLAPSRAFFAAGVGLCVTAAWWFTFNEAAISFDPVPVHSLSFTGPSADALMFVLTPASAPSFDLLVVPGVALGAFFAARGAGEWRLEGFEGAATMPRYILGGALMGFGGMLAGGCAVGAGVSGASIFSLTAWIVLWSIWAGAAVTDRLVD